MELTVRLSGYDMPQVCACGANDWELHKLPANFDAKDFAAHRGYVHVDCCQCGSHAAIWYANIKIGTEARRILADYA